MMMCSTYIIGIKVDLYIAESKRTYLIHECFRSHVQTAGDRIVQDVFEPLLLAHNRVQEVGFIYVGCLDRQ